MVIHISTVLPLLYGVKTNGAQLCSVELFYKLKHVESVGH